MAGEDKRYTSWLQGLPCRKCYGRPCTAHHATQHRFSTTPGGERSKDRRAHDHFALSLCDTCHRELHGLCGQFKGWTRERLQAWENEQIVALRAQFRPGEENDAF